MNIFYTNDTLYINIEEAIDINTIDKLKKRLFRILEDYGINQVELNVGNSTIYDPTIFDNLLTESSQKYQAKIKIK